MDNEFISNEELEKRKQEALSRDLNVLEGLKKESRDLLDKGENHISFGNYQLFTIGNEKYLYCNTNGVAGLMHNGMDLFNPEIIANNFYHNRLWDYYKEPKV